ncbi:hypothetical protein E2C01_006512 [Portunus trituberculatus]|uniref:Uncharacterized protein n=1 Tax=Portunus trituberculatus TaxID=210409 RepID=A0A5B7CX23_PORTR|nr:hypothetical protein [Portunus trituberculatus]
MVKGNSVEQSGFSDSLHGDGQGTSPGQLLWLLLTAHCLHSTSPPSLLHSVLHSNHSLPTHLHLVSFTPSHLTPSRLATLPNSPFCPVSLQSCAPATLQCASPCQGCSRAFVANMFPCVLPSDSSPVTLQFSQCFYANML